MEGQQKNKSLKIKRCFSQINLEQEKAAVGNVPPHEPEKKKSKSEVNELSNLVEKDHDTQGDIQNISAKLLNNLNIEEDDTTLWIALEQALISKQAWAQKTLMTLNFRGNQKKKEKANELFYIHLKNYHELPKGEYEKHIWADNLLYEFASSRKERRRYVVSFVLCTAFERALNQQWPYTILREIYDKDNLNNHDTAAKIIIKGISENSTWAKLVFDELIQSSAVFELKIVAIVLKNGVKAKDNKSFHEWSCDQIISFRRSEQWQKKIIRTFTFLKLLKEDKFYGSEILTQEYIDYLPEIVIDAISKFYDFKLLSKDDSLPNQEQHVYQIFAHRLEQHNID